METDALPLAKLAYSLDETAQVLGISRATVGRLVRSGALRASDLGHRTVRISEEAIRDLLRSHERRGAAGQPTRRFVRKEVAAD